MPRSLRQGELGLDTPPSPEQITKVRGVEIWYYQGSLPKPPAIPPTCHQCGYRSRPPAFWSTDKQYHWWCQYCASYTPEMPVKPKREALALYTPEPQTAEMAIHMPAGFYEAKQSVYQA